jgi:hypothetical protein
MARLLRIAVAGTVVIVGLWVSPGTVVAISGHGDIELAVSVMWSMIRPLHAVRNRLPSRPTIATVTPYFRSGAPTE